MNESAGLPSVMRATARGRWLSAGLAVAAVGALAVFQGIALPQLFDLLKADGSGALSGAAIRTLQAMFAAFGLIGLVTAGILLQHGLRTLRSAQSPPVATWVWRDTPIVRGDKARRLGKISIAAAVLTALLCLGLSGYICLMLEGLSPYGLRPGVTFVNQKPL